MYTPNPIPTTSDVATLTTYISQELTNLSDHNAFNAISVEDRWDASDNDGAQIFLKGEVGNRIAFIDYGVAPPSYTTRSVGTKIALYQSMSGSTVDYAFGIESECLWSSIGDAAAVFKWYAGTTMVAQLTGGGNYSVTGSISGASMAVTGAITGATVTVTGLATSGSTSTGQIDATGQLNGTKVALTSSWDANDAGGQIFLNGANGNRIDFASAGVAPPALTTRSAGTKIVLFPQVYYNTGTYVDYALGVEGGCSWTSIPAADATHYFKWYANTTAVMQLTGQGNLSVTGGVLSSSASSGIGYAAGSGGTVTQGTSKSTGVTLNAICGTITTHGASLAAGARATFTLTNSSIAANDNIILQIAGGASNQVYIVNSHSISAGSCTITITNNAASSSYSDALQIRFTVLKGSNS